MDMDMMSMALASMDMASAQQMQSYSANMMKLAMTDEAQSAQQLLEMLPQQVSSRPQTGDVPAILKGQYIDVYA